MGRRIDQFCENLRQKLTMIDCGLDATIAVCKAERGVEKLQGRADKAGRYAAATIEIATAAIDEAEKASLEAWLTQADADHAKNKPAA